MNTLNRKKFQIILLFLTGLPTYGQVTPCEDYACDTTAIRAILDANDLSIIIEDIINVNPSTGRVDSLYLTNNYRQIPSDLAKLSELKFLVLYSTEVSSLPLEIKQLTKLEFLLLEGNYFSIVPPSITQLPLLKYLNLGANILSSLPPDFNQLVNLENLFLDSNHFSKVPMVITQLPSLKFLNLSINSIQEIPQEISQLQNLEVLNLSKGELTMLPDAIGQLSNLRTLSLSHNFLTELPLKIGQLTNLRSINFSNNLLTFLPDEIGNLNGLTNLIIDNNSLESLPNSIGNLIYMQGLILNNNHLTSLPIEITNLDSAWINVENNFLCELPDTIFAFISRQSGSNWVTSQKLDSATTCDGTDVIIQANQEFNFMEVSKIINEHSILLTFSNANQKIIEIHSIEGKLYQFILDVRRFATLKKSNLPRGLAILKIIDGNDVKIVKIFNR